MEQEKTIAKTKLNYISAGFFFLVIVFFTYLAYNVLAATMKSNNNIDEKSFQTIKWLLCGIFILMSIGCLYRIMIVKIYSLTTENLIIDYPLLSSKKIIPLLSIERIFQKNNIYMYSRMRFDNAIYKEKETTIELKNGEKIKIDLIMAANYKDFQKAIYDAVQTN